MALLVVSQKKNTILYINGMDTSKQEAQQHVQKISQSLSNIPQSFFCQYLYNPTNSNNYVNANHSKEKSKKFSVETGIDVLIDSLIKTDRVFIVTHSNGASQAAKLLEGIKGIFDENDPIRNKISVLNFAPDTLISKEVAKVGSVRNFIFKKDRITFILLGTKASNNSQSQSEITWLKDPKKIPKKKLPPSANDFDKFTRNIQYVVDNAKNRHQFDSYLPHITEALAQKVLQNG